MKGNIILLIILIALYFCTSFVLNQIYGDSFPFLAGEDCWEPDGKGGWVMHGHPDSDMPAEPSINFPIIIYYLPVFIPAFVLIIFLFTPLKKFLENKTSDSDDNDNEILDNEEKVT